MNSSINYEIFSSKIENIDRTWVCRFCLVNTKASRKFEIKTIAQTYKTLTDVDLTLSSDYPTFVCSTCERNLQIAAKTRNDIMEMENCWKKFINEMPLIEEIKMEEVDIEEISFETVEMVIEPMFTSPAFDEDIDDFNDRPGFEMKVQNSSFEGDDNSYENFESLNVPILSESLRSDSVNSDTVLNTPEKMSKSYCQYCKVANLTPTELRKHRQICRPNMTEAPNFTCDICNKTYSSRHGIQTHMKRHAQDRCSDIQSLRYKCSACDKTFSKKSHLNEHDLIHSGITPHICHICGIGKRNRHLMNNHLKSHDTKTNYSASSKPKSSKRYYTCWICPNRIDFKTLEELKSHRKNLHHKFQCEFCKNGFMTNDALQSHILIHRTQNRPHVCKICGGTFSKIGHLNSHVQGKHALRKPFPCEKCPKGFVHRYQLESHIRITHDKIKAFKCTECPVSFGHSKSRILHMRTVHKANL